MNQVFTRISPRILALFLGLFLSVGAFAQITVKGLVKDDLGEPLPGAHVVVKGTTNQGTATDYDGNFTLQCEKGATLVVSYIGFQTKEVSASSNVVVTLSDDSQMLQDVVVIGYGTAKKSDLTGSVTVIEPDEENHGVITSAQDMMQGKIAGVSVTNYGGEPGGGADIVIRGGSSLNASNKPLVVIDGLAIDNNGMQGASNPLSMVNPADIESFTVLKDASATAIYGSRGSNGVIIITTKKGKEDSKVKVSYNGNVSFATRQKSLEVMDGDEYRTFVKNYYGDATYDELYGKGWIGNENTDWQDEIYRGAVSSDHNITLQGGTKHMPYRVSVGYTGNRGILKTSDYRRTTASFNLNPSLADDHLKMNLNGKFMLSETRYANTDAVGEALRMDPTHPVYASDAENTAWKNATEGYWQWMQDGSALGNVNYPYTWNNQASKNPLSLLELVHNFGHTKDFVGNAEFDYAIHGFEDLHLHANLGGDFANGTSDFRESGASPNNWYYGWIGLDKGKKYNLQLNTYAQYSHNWNDKHDFNIMAGYEYQKFHREYTPDGSGYYPEGDANEGERYNINNTPFKTEYYLVSFFGRANYTLLNRYSATATIRRDGSSRFKNHWANFPSAALAWRINEENFLKDARNLSQLKLRLGWGMTGQQDIEDVVGNYYWFATYNVGTSSDSKYNLVGDGRLNRPDVYNTDLKWETTTTYNAGLDLGLWNNRFNVSLDYYYRKTTDLINTVTVPVGSNFRNQMTGNIGSLKNTGFELQLGYTAIDKKDWTWELGFNATYNYNEVTESNSDSPIEYGGIGGTGNTCKAIAVGQSASAFYVYKQAYDADGKPLQGVFVDRNGDGQITGDDRYFYKQAAAPWTLGLTSKLRYKSWDLGFGLRANLGGYVFNNVENGRCNVATIYDNALGYLSNRPVEYIKNVWTSWPSSWPSDYFVQKATFLKCDNITLGYSFSNWTRHKLNGRLYGSVSNVFTITNYSGIDPEVNGGIDSSIYPRPITYQLGVSLNF